MKKILIAVGLSVISISGFASDRFVQGNGIKDRCVIDNKTHLMWAKSPITAKYSWDEAIHIVKILKFCGYSDWRLPTYEEQYELQNEAGYYAPFAYLNTHGFSEVQTDFYWASDVYAPDTTNAWGFFMYSGKVYNEPKTNKNYVWPVRNIN